jgi:hypothetical protein
MQLDEVRDWPIFAVSRAAYHDCASFFSGRCVVGVPHPAGHGQFSGLLNALTNAAGSPDNPGKRIKERIEATIRSRGEYWLNLSDNA